MQVDPRATAVHTMSPYQYAGNNPVMNNDPMGDLYQMVDGATGAERAMQRRFNAGDYHHLPGQGDYDGWATDNGIDVSLDGMYNAYLGGGGGSYMGTTYQIREEQRQQRNALALAKQIFGDTFGVNSSGIAGFWQTSASHDYAGVVGKDNGDYILGGIEFSPTFTLIGGQEQTGNGPGIKQHANESVSLEEFLSSINGLSYWDVVDQIEGRNASKTVLDSQPSGPKLRYVRNPYDGNIMDMRHVLVVGFRHGKLGGALLEVLQYIDKSSRGSAMNQQDFYSNMIGSNFSDLYKHNVLTYPTKLSNYLKEFFSVPARINQDYWHIYRE